MIGSVFFKETLKIAKRNPAFKLHCLGWETILINHKSARQRSLNGSRHLEPGSFRSQSVARHRRHAGGSLVGMVGGFGRFWSGQQTVKAEASKKFKQIHENRRCFLGEEVHSFDVFCDVFRTVQAVN